MKSCAVQTDCCWCVFHSWTYGYISLFCCDKILTSRLHVPADKWWGQIKNSFVSTKKYSAAGVCQLGASTECCHYTSAFLAINDCPSPLLEAWVLRIASRRLISKFIRIKLGRLGSQARCAFFIFPQNCINQLKHLWSTAQQTTHSSPSFIWRLLFQPLG